MKESPILFNAEMVKAVLEGRKTQTRRVIKPPNKLSKPRTWKQVKPHKGGGWMACDVSSGIFKMTELDKEGFKCPYGKIGDRLWVRETFQFYVSHLHTLRPLSCKKISDTICYKAECSVKGKWKPSIHMPRWASRITLEITDVRVERVQHIDWQDSLREGIEAHYCCNGKDCGCGGLPIDNPVDEFQILWNSIYEKRGYGWKENPWVWVVEFKLS